MIYFKSLLFGLAAAIAGMIVWLLGEIAWAAFLVSREMARSVGSGGIGAVSVTSYSVIGALLGFVAGFVWNVRRLKKKLA